MNTWASGVTARYLTAAGIALGDPDITVDVTEADAGGTALQSCRGCPYGKSYTTTSVVTAHQMAQAHATACTGLPKPGGDA